MPSLVETLQPEELVLSLKRDADTDTASSPMKRRKSDFKNYQCPYENCLKAYTKPSRLAEHIYSHTGERPYECDSCEKTFMKSTNLAAHKQIHGPRKMFTCSFPDCTVSCTTRQHLKSHESLHTQPNPYQCLDFPPCTVSFRKKHLLRAHISDEHTHAPPFPCPHEPCDAAFTIQSKLTAHINKVHTPRYFCDDCPATFTKLLDFQRHRRDDHKPRCFTCDLEFSKREVLIQHLQTHKTSLDERKKYICEYDGCQKRYTKPFALKNHVRTVHEKVKPFICGLEGCGKAFGFKKVLQRHELTHTMPAPVRTRKRVTKEVGVIDEIAGTGYEATGRDIACIVDGCEWRFTREYDLKRHLGSMHKDIPSEDVDSEEMDDEIEGGDMEL